MVRVVVHMAVPDAKRATAAEMSHLSGMPQEHAVELRATEGGPSAQWDATKEYNGTWWGASQSLQVQIAQDMLASGYMLGTESWFTAVWEEGGALIQHNLPTPPNGPSFDDFLAAAGLERVGIDP